LDKNSVNRVYGSLIFFPLVDLINDF